ncbi:stalk domain-containing protein [Paenibacillus tarimensis]
MQKPQERTDENGTKRNKATGASSRAARRILLLTLSGALLIHPFAAPAVVSANGTGTQTQVTVTELKLVKEEMLTAGAKRLDYLWTSTRGGEPVRSNVHVIEIDLSNPYVSLDVMSGKNNTVANRNSITNMVKETGAVAGVNADYFNMSAEGVPMGPQITSGTFMSSPSVLQGMYAFALTKDRTPIIDEFGFEGELVAANGQSFSLSGINQTSYMMEVGGQAQRSHVNAMYIYTSAWTSAERPNTANSATTPTEVLVQDGIVVQIAENTTLPLNPPANGYILRTHGTAAKFVKENLTVGSKVEANYRLVSLTTGAKKNPEDYQMMVGGHTILVDGGTTAQFTRSVSGVSGSSAVSRTAIGYSRDNKKVYMITTERQGDSSGMTLSELQNVMVSLGVWKGINLDGGGSTTMVDRPLGDFNPKLAHGTQNNDGTVQRSVVNGIGVYTSAPKGETLGIKASGPNTLFIGQEASYSLKAYDTYYNPIDPAGMTAEWSLSDKLGTFSGSTLTPARAGKATLSIKSGKASDNLPIEVIGQEQIVQMTIDAGTNALQQGAQIPLPVRVKLNDGRELNVPASTVKWELQGFVGSVQNGQLKVEKLKPGITTAYAIARYDGYSAVAVFYPGTAAKAWENFDNVTYPITFQGAPAEVQGTTTVVKGLPGREAASALQITYDFSAGTGGKWAYAVLNGGGRQVEGQPMAITADVYGDGSNNWLRAEVEDAKKEIHYIDLARPIDWTGWQTVRTDMTGMNLAYPIKVRKIYVASPELGQNERALFGQVAIDNIAFEYAGAPAEVTPTVILTAGKKEATINGQAVKLDVAPLILKGTTYLPLKFLADAVEGQVAWDNTAKRATFIRGDKLLDVWLGKQQFVLNGTRSEAQVAPIVVKGRTLVPVRLVSEQLGLTVRWENATKKITIQ